MTGALSSLLILLVCLDYHVLEFLKKKMYSLQWFKALTIHHSVHWSHSLFDSNNYRGVQLCMIELKIITSTSVKILVIHIYFFKEEVFCCCTNGALSLSLGSKVWSLWNLQSLKQYYFSWWWCRQIWRRGKGLIKISPWIFHCFFIVWFVTQTFVICDSYIVI